MSTAAEVEKQDMEIELGGIHVSISVLRPVGSGQKILPIILFLHGGGWVFGSYNSHRILTNQLVTLLGCCVVFVHYSYSPEVKYPVALEECYTTLCWLQQNAASIHATTEGLVVSGDSAGGNLSAALTILAKQRGNTGISFQVLYYPVLDVNFETESYIENRENAFLPRTTMQYVWEAYLETDNQSTLATAVPMVYDEFEGLPPALIITAERDVLRSEGEAYGKKLSTAGVDTVCVRYVGIGHGFLTMPFLQSQAHAAIAQTVHVIKSHWNSFESKL
ncbi:alpha/beta hydrolase fold-domain-containing protein [Mucor mucedo]|uniref:alpha/beta hydrolase fold-domain-containing protein n=1 Tax=Mucor mucedo TaxID=29922 RepID=UPI00221FB5CC|nr:alpha/beta hydrolase fold-domain-containing protein [Mucor mucedo]KAI7887593.1 alpha/beta hydrolase fold-domain-containing protein [Mucor mucedo]